MQYKRHRSKAQTLMFLNASTDTIIQYFLMNKQSFSQPTDLILQM